MHSLQKDHLQNSLIDYYFPDEMMDQEADPNQVLRLLDDMGANNKSYFSDVADQHSVLSVEDDSGLKTEFESQIINIIVPEAFKKVLPIDVGGFAEISIGKADIDQIDASYRQVYKARIIGTLKRMPGLFD